MLALAVPSISAPLPVPHLTGRLLYVYARLHARSLDCMRVTTGRVPFLAGICSEAGMLASALLMSYSLTGLLPHLGRPTRLHLARAHSQLSVRSLLPYLFPLFPPSYICGMRMHAST